MTYEIITPSGKSLFVDETDTTYLNQLQAKGYEVKQIQVSTEQNVCLACEG